MLFCRRSWPSTRLGRVWAGGLHEADKGSSKRCSRQQKARTSLHCAQKGLAHRSQTNEGLVTLQKCCQEKRHWALSLAILHSCRYSCFPVPGMGPSLSHQADAQISVSSHHLTVKKRERNKQSRYHGSSPSCLPYHPSVVLRRIASTRSRSLCRIPPGRMPRSSRLGRHVAVNQKHWVCNRLRRPFRDIGL